MSAPVTAVAVARPARQVRPTALDPESVGRWLDGFGLVPIERAERDGISSWDLLLDGRRRRDIRVTLILDPSLAIVAWVHYAPALGDYLRKSYRQLLRWNDEFPFVKFSLSEDDRPILTGELPADEADEDRLGLLLARLVATCDLLLDASSRWLEGVPARTGASTDGGPGRATLIDRYADRLRELIEGEPPPEAVER